jgi:two-component system, NarL family, nitrate/nitrite response regulator NarL
MPNILLADDHGLVRDTISAYLGTIDDFHVTSVSNLDAALKELSGLTSFDLLILDYQMHGMNGLEGLERAMKEHSNVKVALMSGIANRDVATMAMSRGADGFIPKSLTAASTVNAIRFILSGERYFPFDFGNAQNETPRDRVFSELSEREMQTLEQLCIGLSNKEIARVLNIQEVTVKLHVKNVLAKLKVANRTQAALMAKERHLF